MRDKKLRDLFIRYIFNILMQFFVWFFDFIEFFFYIK